MPLRKGKIDGRVVVEIPDEDWKCPLCGTGPDNPSNAGGGLVLECDGIEFPGEWLDPNGDVCCYGKKKGDIEVCGWGGSVLDVFKAAMRRKEMVPCPCCKGEGVVTKKKAQSYKGKK